MSIHWSLWIIVLTLVNLILVMWVLMANRKVAISDDQDPENITTGHVYDGIEEYDNPLPRWWFLMFIASVVFSAIYLILYPGMGSFSGVLGWTSANQLEAEQQRAQETFNERFGQYAVTPVEDLVDDIRAIKMGSRLFSNNCSQCHGADGGGSYGFPNLTDKDWLWGGSTEKIRQTIEHGRKGMMPGWGAVIGEDGVQNVTEYVLSLSGNEHDKSKLAAGAQVYTSTCVACHGAKGEGNQLLGAPNLSDAIWLYHDEVSGDLRQSIQQSVRNGRANEMPSQIDKLREDKIHLLTAYVYWLALDDE